MAFWGWKRYSSCSQFRQARSISLTSLSPSSSFRLVVPYSACIDYTRRSPQTFGPAQAEEWSWYTLLLQLSPSSLLSVSV